MGQPVKVLIDVILHASRDKGMNDEKKYCNIKQGLSGEM
jgi:hypothetical protein